VHAGISKVVIPQYQFLQLAASRKSAPQLRCILSVQIATGDPKLG
jgi:hypothetical protein